MLRLIATIAVSASLLLHSLYSHAQFVQDRDLISLHYDHAPDRDDGHATVSALEVVTARGITPHVVSGAYGTGNSSRYQPASEAVMRATWGSNWLDAHANRQAAVNATTNRWLNTLLNGGDIWVAEGGQSDFTSDVVRRIRNTNPDINTRSRIHVIQHSIWNEQQSNQADLNYSRNNTDYKKIADGNGANATANLNQRSASFVRMARASQFGSAWNAAFNYLNPNNKLDFSDTVELLYILGIGTDQIATVNDFAAVFLDQSPTPLATRPTAWSDSYSVNGQCYCDTSFDHGLANISVDTPAGRRTVRQICSDITDRFGIGSFENRIYFNTAQCGHPPANNAPDETICPGIPRGINDYMGSRCQQTGSRWNLDQLYRTEQTPEVAAQSPETASPENTAAGFPVCGSGFVDSDGDGYGWENNQTCIVAGGAAATSTPQAQSQTPVTVQAVSLANESNTTTGNPTVGFPVCSDAVIDFDGDGFAWENNQSCLVSGNSADNDATSVQTVESEAPVENNLFSDFPVCSDAVIDFDGDGFAWENNQSCVVSGNSAASEPTSSQTSDTVAPVSSNPFSDFPVCSDAVVDSDGDGFAWENNQSCVVSGSTANGDATSAQATDVAAPVNNNPFADFPVCSDAVTDFDGDGFAWENNQSCVISS